MKYNLFIGRWSPFHMGHKTIIDSFVKNGKPVCIAIRDSQEKYPLWIRELMIYKVYEKEIEEGLVRVIKIPDIEMVVIGRNVGYSLVEVPQSVKIISGTEIRESSNYDNLPPEVRKVIEEWEDEIHESRCFLCGQCGKEDGRSSDEDGEELQDSK